MISLKRTLHWLFCLLLYPCVITAYATPIVDQWDVIKSTYFNDQSVLDAQTQIEIEAPLQAEDAAIVPFSFKVNLQDDFINKVYVLTDANPILLTATLSMIVPQKTLNVSTRIRLEKNSMVRVIAKTQNGHTLMKTVAIKTPGGGCGGGAMTDEATLRASAGSMKIRFIKSESNEKAGFALNIKHPMRTGFERTFQGYYAKAWFIENVDFLIDGKLYLHALLGPGISADPYLKFNLPQKSAEVIRVEIKDNEGKLFQQAFHS